MQRAEYEATRRLEGSHWWFVGMRAVTKSLLLPYQEAARWDRLLDSGCGTGGNYSFLSRYARDIVGIDYSPLALGFYSEQAGGAVAHAAGQALPFASGTFGAVTSFDVLSQLPPGEDDQALRECERVLRPGGLLLVRVPAYQWLFSGHDAVLRTYHRYNKRELARKITAAGLRVRRLTYANTLLFPVAAARRLLQKLKVLPTSTDLVRLPGPINQTFLLALRLESALLRRTGLPFGLSLVAIAQKQP